jgi:hypothetical protein
MNQQVRLWLLDKARCDLADTLKRLNECERLRKLYHARNQGEDGYTPGIWYQENECTLGKKQLKLEAEHLQAVVDSLSRGALI